MKRTTLASALVLLAIVVAACAPAATEAPVAPEPTAMPAVEEPAEEVMEEVMPMDIVDIALATREPKAYGLDIGNLIQYGASPRASIYLNQAAKAHAFLNGRGYVTPQDVKTIGPDVLRHRIILSYEAEAEEMTSDDVIARLFEHIEVP